MNWRQAKRGTGRTYRMLSKVRADLGSGQSTVVVCASKLMCMQMTHKLAEMIEQAFPKESNLICVLDCEVRFKQSFVKFVCTSDPTLSAHEKEAVLRGVKAPVVFDHHAVEQLWGHILDRWTEFDA